MKIRHIINPVSVKPSSDLYIAQPITFASMITARREAKKHNIYVDLCFTCYPEDVGVAPGEFRNAGLLERSVLDVGHFGRPRKLPLIQDIVKKALNDETVDLLIYTNVDIAVQPDFYIEVQRIAEQGYDAFTINRRTLPKHYETPEQLPLMYLEAGEKHPGHDCFVFSPQAAPNYNLGDGCIGANWIGRILLVNLMARARCFHTFENKRLTFHIGDDRAWSANVFNDYDIHNERQLVKVLDFLLQHEDVSNLTALSEMHRWHREQLHSREMIQQNTFSRPPKAQAIKVLPTAFKGSTDWKTPFLLDQSPIFVVGHPRSGTTLLQSKLMTQSGVVSLPETHFFSIVRNQLNVKEDRVSPVSLDKVFDKLRERFPLSVEGEAEIRHAASNGVLSPKMLFEAFVADGLLSNYDLHTIRASYFVEKTPDHAERLEIILRWYPRARIVNIVRHPEKAIISRRQNFAGESEWPIQQHALRWRASADIINKYRGDKRFISVRLEDLVADEAGVMKSICDFCGILFDPKRLIRSGELADKIALPWEHWKQGNREQVSADIAHRDSRRLDALERRVLWTIAGEQMAALGYSVETQAGARPVERTRSVVVFSHVPTHPTTHGNSKRINAVCQNFKDLGFRVSLFYYLVHPNLPVDYKAMIEAWEDVKVYPRKSPLPESRDGYFQIDDVCEERLSEDFSRYCEERNAGVVMVNYVFYSRLFCSLSPDVLKILDTHDRFSDRHLKLKAAGVPSNLWWFSFTPKEEGIGLSRADVVLAIQDEEAKYFSTITKKRVEVLPQLEPRPTTIRQPATPFRRAGFLGSDNPINAEAAKEMVRCYLNAASADALPELVIAGKVCGKLQVDHPRIQLLGPIEKLDDFYASVDVIVIPLEFGTGLKIKAVEALAYGLPILSTAHGAIGLDSDHPFLNLSSVSDVIAKLAALSEASAGARAQELVEHCRLVFERYNARASSALRDILEHAGRSLSSTMPTPQERGADVDVPILLSETRALLARLAPSVKPIGMRALFVGHGFHQRTNSSRFFIDYLSSLFDLQLYWLTPHEADSNYPKEFIGEFDVVFFWQLMPDRRVTDQLKTRHIVCIPMYDATGVSLVTAFNPKRWESLKGYPFVSFCKLFHEEVKRIGIESFYLQYAPREFPSLKPRDQIKRKPKVFFLFRRGEISWAVVRQLFGPEDVASVHIHVSTDPKQHFEPPSEIDVKNYRVTFSSWFEKRAEYDELIENHDVFVAPRLFEGIGMAFLDAMARGLCVVSPDRPTMNEYIEHGESGFLFDPSAPKRIDISNWKDVGLAGRKRLERISEKFDLDLKFLRLFLKTKLLESSSIGFRKREVERTFRGRKVLLVFPHNPFLRSNGVQARFMGLLEYFKSKEVVVDMLSHSNFVDKWNAEDPLVSRLVRELYLEDFQKAKRSGLSEVRGKSPLPDFAFKDMQKRFDELLRVGDYDLVVIGYVHWANLVRNANSVKKMIMIEDCISQNLLDRNGGSANFDYDSSIRDEFARVDMFDVAGFISPDELRLFSESCRNVKMFHVPHMIDVPKLPGISADYTKRPYDLIFVGSDNPFNVRAISWFLTEVWPSIAETTSLVVVGGVCDELRKLDLKLPQDNLHLLGRVDDLSSIYQNAKIAICPMHQGTGLKIKVAEALAYGLPVVALPAGLIGMTGDRGGCLEVHTAEQFRETIRSILGSSKEWARLSALARKTSEEQFGADNVGKAFDAMLSQVFAG